MPYPIKNTGTVQTLPNVRVANYGAIGVNQGGYGLTSSTAFWNGKTPNVGGYVTYSGNGTSSPTMYISTGDTQLIALANQLGGSSITTIGGAINYLNFGGGNYVCVNMDCPNIVTSGLTLYLDAGYTVSYPKSSNSWIDISGNGHNGSLINGPTYSSDGGGCIVSDGSDDGVTVPDSINLDLTNFTLDGWVWFNQHKDYGSLLVKGPGGAGQLFNYCFFFYASSLVCGFGDGSNFYSAGVLTTPNVPINTWHHIVGVYNSVAISFYLNGVLMQSNPIVATPYQNTNNLNIIQSDYPIDGKVISAKVYNRALSATEILQNYYAGLQKLIPTDNLVLWLDGQNTNTRVITPTIALDTSVNNYNGNFINAASLAHREAGTSFYFDGVDDRITNNGTLPSFSLGLTIDMLIKPAVLSANTFTFILQMCSQSTYVGYLNQGTVGFSLEINGAQFAINSLISTPPSVFSRITLTYDNSNVRLYKNGVLLTTIPISGVLTNTAFPIPGGVFYSLGSSYSGSSPFKGIVSTFRVYNRALTSTEISNIYNANIPRYS